MTVLLKHQLPKEIVSSTYDLLLSIFNLCMERPRSISNIHEVCVKDYYKVIGFKKEGLETLLNKMLIDQWITKNDSGGYMSTDKTPEVIQEFTKLKEADALPEVRELIGGTTEEAWAKIIYDILKA